jgi:drug/metabolite transporter (DMT)-like permease
MLRSFFDKWGQNKFVLVIVLMTCYSIQSLVVKSTQTLGKYPYDVVHTVFYAELLKLIFASALLSPEVRCNLKFRSSLPYILPGLLYLVQNQLVFISLRYLSPPEYQLLNNGKLFTTSLVYRVVMKKQLRLLQWLSLALLGIGMSVATQPAPASELSATLWTGVLVMIAVCWCSAIAGVLNEKLIKSSPSIGEANVWLYAYGCLLAFLQAGGLQSGLLRFEGFGVLTWCTVVCNAILGQSIAYIMRYADSIVKIYAVSAGMVFTTIVSAILFNYKLQIQMVCGYTVCAISSCLYYLPDHVLLATDSELIRDGCSRRSNGHQKLTSLSTTATLQSSSTAATLQSSSSAAHGDAKVTSKQC